MTEPTTYTITTDRLEIRFVDPADGRDDQGREGRRARPVATQSHRQANAAYILVRPAGTDAPFARIDGLDIELFEMLFLKLRQGRQALLPHGGAFYHGA